MHVADIRFSFANLGGPLVKIRASFLINVILITLTLYQHSILNNINLTNKFKLNLFKIVFISNLFKKRLIILKQKTNFFLL